MKAILYHQSIDFILPIITTLNGSLNKEYLSLICSPRSQSRMIQTEVYIRNGPFLCKI
jgi:hypothetical protein